MKKNYFWMMLLVMASVLGLVSCSSSTKDDPFEKSEFLGANHHLEVGDLEFALYDITVTYTDLMSKLEKTEKLTKKTWDYQFVMAGMKKPEKYVLKVEATLKSNAEELAKKLAESCEKITAGDKHDFHYGYCTDATMRDFTTSIISSTSDLIVTVPSSKIADYIKEFPSRTIFNEVR